MLTIIIFQFYLWPFSKHSLETAFFFQNHLSFSIALFSFQRTISLQETFLIVFPRSTLRWYVRYHQQAQRYVTDVSTSPGVSETFHTSETIHGQQTGNK